jgi:hypothetical protein
LLLIAACALPLWSGRSAQAAARAPSPAPAGSAPSAQMQQLASMVGRWQVRQSLWSEPGGAPAIDRGSAVFALVLNARHLRQELVIASKQGTFEGVGYLGYDEASGRYDSLWMDVNFSGVILAHGRYEHGAYEFTGTVPDADHPEHPRPLRQVIEVQDADHFTTRYYEQHDGSEMLAVKLEYSRVR